MTILRLVARRSRTDAGLLALVAVLVAAAAFLLTAFPVALTGIGQAQLRHALESTPVGARSLLATADFADAYGRLPTDAGRTAIDRTLRQIPTQFAPPLGDLVSEPTWIVTTSPQTAPGERQVVFTLDADWESRVRIVASADAEPDPDAVPVAVSAAAAEAWGVGVGDELGTEGAVVDVVYEPADPDDPFWALRPGLAGPIEIRLPGSPLIQRAMVIVSPRYLTALEVPFAGAQIEAAWLLDTRALRVSDAAEVAEQLRARVARAQNLPTGPSLKYSAGSAATIEHALGTIQAGSSMLALATIGPLALLLLTLGLGAAAIRQRRGDALALLRARGASAGGLRTTAGLEAAAIAVPAGVLGAVLAAIITHAAPLAAAAGALGAAAVPVAVLAALGGAPGGRRGALVRTIAEVLVVVAASASVVLVLRRGFSATDPLLLAAPLLTAAATAVGVLRLYPFAARGLLAVARRRPGAVGLVGTAQALHAPSVGGLGAFALVVAGASAAFSLALWPSVAGDDPLASGLRALFAGGAAGCAVLAAGAVALGVTAARRRRVELVAVLRALGMPSVRAIALWESVPVVVLAVALGLALGLLEATAFAGAIAAATPPAP